MLQLDTNHRKAEHGLESLRSTLAATDEILMLQLNKTHNKTEDALEAAHKLRGTLDHLQEQLEGLTQKQSELMESTLEESYYRRGLELEKRGEFKDAIAAYNEALRVNPSYAEAYMQLGVAYARNGQKQQAIAHLRSATKLFFESGSLERYHEARSLSEQIHAGQTSTEENETPLSPSSAATTTPEERLVVNELFV
jgi:tetratricopeptide (TPR) repeat protein